MAGVRISPKHGLNPCIPVCVFCGQEKHEVAILGKLKGDAQAPMKAVLNYEPCEECAKNWSMGIPLIRVSSIPPQKGMPPMTERSSTKLYPTGQYSVITTEAAKRIFDYDAPAGSPIMVDAEVFDDFMAKAKETEQ